MAVNVGSIEGTITLKDQYTAAVKNITAENLRLKTASEELAKSVDVPFKTAERAVKKAESEITRARESYRKLAGALDPVTHKTHQYDRAIKTLNEALSRGIIDQQTYNRRLDEAKQKFSSAEGAANQYRRTVMDLGQGLSSLGGDLTRFVTLPLAAIGGLSIKSAKDFESSFAGVRKTIDATEEEFAQLSRSLRDLAAGPNAVPIDVNKLNAVAEAAGQLGIAKQDILDFTRTMVDLGETTDLTADQAATSVAQFQNIFGQAGREVDRFGSTLVALGNNGASTERQILEMGLRIAGAGNQLGLSQGEVLAYASALSSLGIEAEAGGSAISKVMIQIALAVSEGGRELENFAAVSGMTASEFSTAFKEDAAGAVNSFISGLGNIKDSGGDVLGVLNAMGISEIRMRDALLRASGAGDLLTDSLALQARAWQENRALTDEAQKRYQTLDSQLRIFINQAKDVGITLGTAMIPLLKDLLDVMRPLIGVAVNMAEAFAGLPKGVRATVLVMGALAAAIGPVLFVTGQLITSWGAIIAVAPKMAGAITLATGPWGVIAAAIAAATLAITTWIDKWRQASEEATAIAIKLGNLEGAALGFYRAVQASGGKVSETALKEAHRDADLLARELLKAQEGVKRLKKTIEEGSPDQSYIARLNLEEAEKNVQSLSTAYERQKKALSGVTEVTDKAAPVVSGLAGAFDIQGEDADKAAKNTKRLAEQLSNLLAIQQEQLRYLRQREDELGNLPENTAQARFEAEQAINEEHEYRLDLLAKQEQYGKKIGKELADSARSLKKLERDIDLKLKLKFIDPVPEIQDVFDRLRGALDQGMNQTMDRLREIADQQARDILAGRDTDPVAQSNAEMFDDLRRAHEEFWQEYSQEVRAGWMTATDVIKVEMAKINAAVESGAQGALTVAEAEKELARLRAQLLDAHLAEWGGFFSTLGSMFGGIFQQISQAINSIQQAVQAGNQAGGLLQGAGAGAWASSLGAVFGTVAAIYEVYKAVDAQIEKNKRRKWGEVTSVEVVDGQWSQEAFSKDRNGQEVSSALRNLIREIVGSIGGVLDDLPQITIRARKDGKEFSAYVAGIWVGTFSDAQTAIEEGVRYAVTHANFAALSQEFVQALKMSIESSLDELQANIDTARSVRRARIGDTGTDYVELSDRRLQEMDAARRLGLSIEDLARLRREEADAIKYSALGIDTSISNLIKDLASLDAGIQEASKTARASLQQQIQIMREQLESAQRPSLRRTNGDPDNGGGGRGQGAAGVIYDFSEAVDENTQRLRDSLAAAEAELAKIPEALSDLEVEIGVFGALDKYIKDNRRYEEDRVRLAKAKVEIEFALIRAQLAMWGKLEQFAGLLDDAYARALEMAEDEARNRGGGRGQGRGAGAGGGDRDSARTFLRDRRFDLALAQMDDYARRVAEVSREYQVQIDQAGKDKKLRAELIALRDKELAQLAEEQRRSTTESFREFLGLVTPFDQVRQTASDLIKDIQSSPFGDARKARMIGRVMEELDKQIDRLSRQEALDLFGGMISDLERFGADETMLFEARKSAALLEHTLNLENYRVRIAALEAEGKLAPEVLAKLKRAFEFLEGVDVTKFVPRPGNDPAASGPATDPYGWVKQGTTFRGYADDVVSGVGSVSDALKTASDLLKKYKDQGIDPYHLAVRELNEEFETIRKGLGNTAEVASEYEMALRRIRKEFSEPLVNLGRELSQGEFSGLSIEDQFASARADWERLTAAIRDTGDLSLADDAVEAAERSRDLARRLYGTSTGGYAELTGDLQRRLRELGIGVGTGGVGGSSVVSQIMMPDTPRLNAAIATLPRPDIATLPRAERARAMEIQLERQTSATKNVEDAVEIHAVRQERLLKGINDNIMRLVEISESNQSSIASLVYGSPP